MHFLLDKHNILWLNVSGNTKYVNVVVFKIIQIITQIINLKGESYEGNSSRS